MTEAQIFVDTNILIYAVDRDAGEKHELARSLVASLWDRNVPPAISIQVLQEYYHNIRRKGTSPTEAREFVSDYLAWRVIVNDAKILLAAMDESGRWLISFWDGLIIAAAKSAGAAELWSEDLNSGQDYGGVRVVNPFNAAFR